MIKKFCFHVLWAVLLVISSFTVRAVHKIKPEHTYTIHLNEPSELVSKGSGQFFLLANKAKLYEMNAQGKTGKALPFSGYDIEAACMADGQLCLIDESLRIVYLLDAASGEVMRSYSLHYEGARNLGFEAVCYLQDTQHFLLATEKAPCLFYEYNKEFQQFNQFSVSGIREVSSMTYYQNDLYVLSDEDATVYKVDPKKHVVIEQWRLPMLNPEGICIDDRGHLLVVSDDMNKLFDFQKP